MDELFRQATGWLGWVPAVALSTPIPQILMALDGKVEFTTLTNPFGGGKKAAGATATTPEQMMALLDAL